MDDVLEKTGYLKWLDDGSEENISRIENIKELRSVASSFMDLGEFLEGEKPGGSFEKEGERQDQIVDLDVFHGFGMLDVPDALVNGYPGADTENQDGHHEGPEIDFLPVTEWVLGVGQAPGTVQAHQEKDLVACIHDRVDALGEHGTAAGERRGAQLGHRDQGIAGHGGENDLAGSGMGHMESSGTRVRGARYPQSTWSGSIDQVLAWVLFPAPRLWYDLVCCKLITSPPPKDKLPQFPGVDNGFMCLRVV